ncbi:MAG: hypothetical protein CBE33_05645 [Candidatus Pelagibacter sp. TMED273]|nr:MAG: hypothetical protein CBE33_05645 [Candidatus Pelagibacter sp. TMED273]
MSYLLKNKMLIFCGISHLSINYGVTAAKLNYNVSFFDNNKKINDFLNKKIKYNEPKLDKYLKEYSQNISFISNLPHDLSKIILFIAIDIKTSEKNISNYNQINKMINYLNQNIKKKLSPLVIMSQVKPSFTRSISWPKNLLYYQVETLVFGNAISRAENPERIIIGTANGLKVKNKLYLNYLNTFKTYLIYMKYEEAELCKMFINSYLVANVTLTNNLAKICKKLNLDWNKPKKALKLDKRIGKYAYLNPGLGISGGNLERDIYNLNTISKNLKLNSKLFEVFINESNKQKKWINNQINYLTRSKLIKKSSKIGVVGISYKDNTNSIKNSPSLKILSILKDYNLICYDPLLQNLKLNSLNIKWLNLKLLINRCDVLFIMHKNIQINTLLDKKNSKIKNKVIIDPYNIIKNTIKNNIIYHDSL